MPESLGFKNRNRRPPRDPFNALLSLSYTLAGSEIAPALPPPEAEEDDYT